MSGDGFQVDPVAVRSVAGQASGVTGQLGTALSELEGLHLEGSVYATIGSAVAAAGSSVQSQLVSALRGALQLFETINRNVNTAADGYSSADTAVAHGFGQTTQAQTTQAQTTLAQNAQNTQTPAQATPGTLDGRVVDSIMRSEGAGGEQGGVREAYGFRESEHNGYDQIMAARNQYGQGSPEERAVVAGLLEQHARQAGALNFTDPGVQAAIVSSAHMRGPAGTQAILNSMVDGTTPTRTGTLTQQNIQAIQGMTPQDFQQQFRDARVNYDQTIYGNTITHQGGHTDTWWHRYGNGLTQRYDREQQQFLGMSPAQNP
jgi:uncharacterized protein YukE